MLVVKVELWRHGNPNDVTHLGTAVIAADASGEPNRGNYRARFGRKGAHATVVDGRETAVLRKGTVRGFPRRRLGPWDLLYRALRDAVGDRNPDGS